MDIFETNPLESFPTTDSQHPVLTALNNKVTALEANYRMLQARYAEYADKLETALIDGANAYDLSTIEYIANAMGLELSVPKEIEVNVTFSLTVDVPLGKTIDPEWDIDFVANHEYIIDYSSDVIYSKEA